MTTDPALFSAMELVDLSGLSREDRGGGLGEEHCLDELDEEKMENEGRGELDGVLTFEDVVNEDEDRE